MGGCCCKQLELEGVVGGEIDGAEDGDDARIEDGGSRVWLQGNSRCTSMFTQGGRKGINQDAMTVWEDFAGEKGLFFCAVMDGHGPSGHRVAGLVRDLLPARLSTVFKLMSSPNYSKCNSDVVNGKHKDDNKSRPENKNLEFPLFPLWKSSLVKSFEDMDEELFSNSAFECFSSGTTAVTVIKQEDHLIIANLGDSRAVLCTRGKRSKLVPVQLTVDLKPNLPSEAERFNNCKGRVLALPDEPGVYRLWMPDENSPGLAMSRAFGDFCMKDYGLISVPEVSYRKITEKDEFVVLASDGIWDVLSNTEVIRTVASAKRSMAAQLLVDRAVREWKMKYPGYKMDDCTVICLFLKTPPLSTKSTSKHDQNRLNDHKKSAVPQKSATRSSSEGHEPRKANSKEEYSALEGVSRLNSVLSISRFSKFRVSRDQL